jgi:hypothetical protein
MIGRRFRRRLRLIVLCLASNGPRALAFAPRRVEGHVEAGKIARLPHPTT